MREIKFRFWDSETSKWYDNKNGDCVLEDDGTVTQISVTGEYDGKVFYGFRSRRDLIPVQYTGLKDENGKEIYESDIIQDKNGKKYLIKWGINSNGFIAKTNEVHGNVYSSYHLAPITEVIGNIFENPSLL